DAAHDAGAADRKPSHAQAEACKTEANAPPGRSENTGQRTRDGMQGTTQQHPSANTKVNPFAWRRRTRAVRSDASEARKATREPLTNGDPAGRKKRRARCNDRSPQQLKAFPRA
ncbi:MAG: hypothetical protein ACK8QZ_12780, partial [Anaerolineales bacterium]